MFTSLSRRSLRRGMYGLLSLAVALFLWVGMPQPGYARSWLDLILRGVQIIQLSNVDDRQEVQIGQGINQQLISREIRLNRNREINDYVNQIGQRLATNSSRPDLPYTFQVVDDRGVNAFATMGGFVYVNAGLMAAADNEAQLASVISHEIGHIARRHALKQMRQSAIAQGVASAAGLDRNTAVNIGVELALRRPNSRQDELEADQDGLAMMQKAGYAPIATVNFMQKLLGSGSPPTFLSTHPATSDRIRLLEQAIDPATANQGDGLNNAAYRARLRPLLR